MTILIMLIIVILSMILLACNKFFESASRRPRRNRKKKVDDYHKLERGSILVSKKYLEKYYGSEWQEGDKCRQACDKFEGCNTYEMYRRDKESKEPACFLGKYKDKTQGTLSNDVRTFYK